jgi:hypothetical protein
MNDGNKLLKLLFVVLLIAVIGEVIYLFTLPNEPIETTTNQDTSVESQRKLSGPSDKNLPSAYNITTLDSLSTIALYPNTKTTIVSESRNKVSDIRTEKVIIGGFESPLGLKFEYEKGLERWVHFLSTDLEKMKIYYDESGGGIKKPANFSDIKKGDTILMIGSMNPFYPHSDPRLVVEIELNIIR